MNKMQAGPGRLVGSLVDRQAGIQAVTLFHIYMHIQISYRQLGSLGSRRLDKAFFSSENTNRSEGARVSNMCCSHRAAAGLSGRSWLCAEGSEDLFGLLQAFCMGMSICSLHSSMSFVSSSFCNDEVRRLGHRRHVLLITKLNSRNYSVQRTRA